MTARRCRKGLHLLTSTNVIVHASTLDRQCKACFLDNQRRRIAAKRYVYVPCPIAGCDAKTRRIPENADTYVCPRHRADPPPWWTHLGLRVEGVRLVAA